MDEKYKKVLDRIINIDLGIYPEYWEGRYEKRTEYMNGWNDASIKHAEAIEKICEEEGIEL